MSESADSRVRSVRSEVTSVLLSEFIETSRSSRTVLVLFRFRLLLIDVVEKGSEDFPGNVEFVVSNKVGVITLKSIENESPVRKKANVRKSCESRLRFVLNSLVSFGNFEIRESSLVGQVHLGRYGAHRKSRSLRVHLEVDSLSRLNANDEFVTSDLLEDTLSNVLVLDTDLSLLFVEGCSMRNHSPSIRLQKQRSRENVKRTFSSFEDERNTFPPRRVDVKDGSSERRAD